ncbi:type II toxin-antitoxin system RelB/DinJ family antitoxin [Acidipila sp. EB88]|nr:type II toxin-antitoxin system RelB/DinJ family antitoxin [Acidipila sp. EB88]
MLSQAATKVFFKTSEPRAAKWISETLGEIEVERLKESRTAKLLSGHSSYTMEIATKPLVMASEIAGLAPSSGYIKQENRVMPVKFAYVPKRSLQPVFVERKTMVTEPRYLSEPVAGDVKIQLSEPKEAIPVETLAAPQPAMATVLAEPNIFRSSSPSRANQHLRRKRARRVTGSRWIELSFICITMDQENSMPANALVQTRIDSSVKAKAAAILEELGMTVSDAVRILLTRTANEGALPFPLAANAAAHDVWFRAKVQEAIDDPRPAVAHDKVKARFAKRRAAALKKAKSSQ